MNSFIRKLRWLAERRRKEAELRQELQFHLEQEAEERQASGLPEETARWAARRELGNLTLVAENTRAQWGWSLAEQFAQDVRYSFRTMAANRLFTVLAVLSLALGIGANTAIYSFLDAILLRSLPVSDPESLVVLNWRAKTKGRNFVMHAMSGTFYGDDKTGVSGGIFPYPAFELFRQYDSVFSNVFAHCQFWQMRKVNLASPGNAGIAMGWSVTGDFFHGLGVSASAGRLLLPDDDRPGATPVAVISRGFSERRFGGAAGATGQKILIDNFPFTIVGVAPAEFFGVDPSEAPDVFLPMHTNELMGAGKQFGFVPKDYLAPNYYWVQIMGRLRPGVTREQAQAILAPAFAHWVAGTASNDQERANLPVLTVTRGAGGLDSLRHQYSEPLMVLVALVGLILALACANVANLLLARAAARRREMALRLSLGAGRWRIIRQLMTESILLASLGGALGVLFAGWGIRFLTLLLGNGRAGFTMHAGLNWHVLATAAALSILTGVLFGLAPALEATRVDVMPGLKGTRSGPERTRRVGMGQMLLVFQIAASLLMLIAAGLFVRTLSNLQSVELGFNRENVLLFQIDARKAGHKDPELAAFYGDLRQRFNSIPGVRSASLSEDALLEAGTGLPIGVAGEPPRDSNRILSIGPAFFATMQIPILAGREFDERDRPSSHAVAVINEVFAKTNFGDRNPLGQHLILRKPEPGDPVARHMEIVGVTRNARYGYLTSEIPPVVYLPFDQGFPLPEQEVYALRTTGDPLRYVGAVREIVRQADSRVPVSEFRSQAADIDRNISQEIAFARLCSGFAILALVIACVGLYGSVSYSVARRTKEIGIRMALGARRGLVVGMVLRDVLVVSAVGLSIGLGAARLTSKFVASLLYGIEANDPLSMTLGATILVASALLAAYLPARKASLIEPTVALRHE